MIAAALLAAAVAAPSAPDALSRLGWLAGCWRRETPRRVVEEQWMAPAGGLMLGAGRTTDAATGALADYEQLRIVARGDTLAFTALPWRQAEATFVAVRITDSLVVFENPAHDFPQRIGYRLVHADSMVAWIEGESNGRARRVEFPSRRVPCPGGAR